MGHIGEIILAKGVIGVVLLGYMLFNLKGHFHK